MDDYGDPEMSHTQGLPSQGSQAGERERNLDTDHCSCGDQSCVGRGARRTQSVEESKGLGGDEKHL